MIKVDLSKATSPRLGLYLLGLIPGVFFEASIAIGNPHFATSVMSRLHEIYSFGSYALLFLFLASGLVIGSAFFSMAWIVERLIFSAFGVSRYLVRMTFGFDW